MARIQFFKDVSLSAFTAGFVAVLVGFTSSVAIVFQAAQALHATPEMIASWMWALGLGMGLCTLLPYLLCKRLWSRHAVPTTLLVAIVVVATSSYFTGADITIGLTAPVFVALSGRGLRLLGCGGRRQISLTHDGRAGSL